MIDISDLFNKGWVVLEDPNVDLGDIENYLREKYLSVFPSAELVECTENFQVEESDRIVEWHNDSRWGMNVTVLYYLDEQQPATGGSISLRNNVLEIEETIYPKEFQLIIMSQKSDVEHRAEYSSIRRHMFNVDFDVEGF
jgi:hypothetical protein